MSLRQKVESISSDIKTDTERIERNKTAVIEALGELPQGFSINEKNFDKDGGELVLSGEYFKERIFIYKDYFVLGNVHGIEFQYNEQSFEDFVLKCAERIAKEQYNKREIL
jgi:hypothetical protein